MFAIQELGRPDATRPRLTVALVSGILFGDPFTQQPRPLLAACAAIWLTSVIAFALWYWDLDRGGAAARARVCRRASVPVP
jgi:hypothetical protein